MSVPFMDLTAQHEHLREALTDAFARVLSASSFILGTEVYALEAALAKAIGVSHAIGVSSGTDALLVSLMALGVGSGDEVVTTPFSFFATAGVVHRLGARVVFCDVTADDLLLDAARVPSCVTDRTRALIPVHLFGQMCDVPSLRAAARGVPVVEDAAQAILAQHAAGAAGALGELAAFSFFPAKNLGALGDAGLVTTQDPDLAERVRRLRVHGAAEKYLHSDVGGNFRIDALQAALLRCKLPQLGAWTAARRDNAEYYEGRFLEAGVTDAARGPGGLRLPRRTAGHVFNQYVVRLRGRDALQDALARKEIGTAVYYPRPLHLQDCFRSLGYGAGSFPVAEEACEQVLALPIFPELGPARRQQVADAVIAHMTSSQC